MTNNKDDINMEEVFSRAELLLGTDAIEKLHNSHVAVFGVGGVGGYAAEALVRTGVGTLDIIDGDVVCESNLNRQIISLCSTLGMPKAEAFAKRAKDINPNVNINAFSCFYTAENADEFDLKKYDYIVDAIDMLSAKTELIKRATDCGVNIISSMGAGNKLDPTRFEVTDIYKTTMCPLAKKLRKELRALGVEKLDVVYSTEPPARVSTGPVGSIASVVSVAGMILANTVIMKLSKSNI